MNISQSAAEGIRYVERNNTSIARGPRTFGFLQIDSKDRQVGDTLANFSVPISRIFPMTKIARLAPLKIQFIWAIPNVNVRNNLLALKYGSTTTAIAIPQGFYTNTQLAAAIQTAVRAALTSTTFTVTLDTNTFYFIFTDTTNFSLVKANTPDILDVIGMNFNVGAAPALTFTSGLPLLTYTRYVNVSSNQLTQYTNVKDNMSSGQVANVLFTIYLPFNLNRDTTGNFEYCFPGTDVQFENRNLKWIGFDENAQLVNPDIYLTDEWSQPLYFPPGHPDYILLFQTSTL
jgi:hypothetical protein